MPTLETLSESDLRGPLKPASLQRARGYVSRVQNPVRVGQSLRAEVPGTRLYDVEVDVGPDGIQAQCTCPYNWAGYCKHVGAVLLKWIRSPGSFEVRESGDGSGQPSLEVEPLEPPASWRPDEVPDWATTPFEARQQENREALKEWLEEVKLNDLREMGRNRDWTLRGTRKAQIVQQVADHVSDRDDVEQAVAGLDDEHAAVLRALDIMSIRTFISDDHTAQVARHWSELKTYKQFQTYTRHLWERGLALPGYTREAYSGEDDFIPWVLARHFPPLLVGLTTDGPADTAASGLRLAEPYDLARAANQIVLLLEKSPTPLRPPMPRPRLARFHPELQDWDYVPEELAEAKQQGRFSRGSELVLTVPPQQRSLPDEAIERLAPIAGGEARLEFIYALLVASGVLLPGSPATVWPEVQTEFFRRDELEQGAILFDAYTTMTNWSALWEVLRREPELSLKRPWRYGYYKSHRLRSELAGFRQLVLRILALVPDDRWVAVGDFFNLMRSTWPAFSQEFWEPYYAYGQDLGRSQAVWFLARGDRPLGEGDPADWDLAQGNLIHEMLTGPLHWLGLADLQLDDGDLVAFRLHGLGDLYWDWADRVPAPRHSVAQREAGQAGEAVAVGPGELTITVEPSAVSAQAHSLLDQVARLEVTEPHRFVYRLDAQAAYESFEEGVVLDDLLADWERLLGTPVPDAIGEQLAAWWQAYGQVRIYQDLTVVEFGDEYALAEMKAVTSLDEHLVAEISPRLVVIRPEALEPLVAELERAGYTPKRADRDGRG